MKKFFSDFKKFISRAPLMWLKFGWTRKQASTTSFIGTETRQALRRCLTKRGNRS